MDRRPTKRLSLGIIIFAVKFVYLLANLFSLDTGDPYLDHKKNCLLIHDVNKQTREPS